MTFSYPKQAERALDSFKEAIHGAAIEAYVHPDQEKRTDPYHKKGSSPDCGLGLGLFGFTETISKRFWEKFFHTDEDKGKAKGRYFHIFAVTVGAKNWADLVSRPWSIKFDENLKPQELYRRQWKQADRLMSVLKRDGFQDINPLAFIERWGPTSRYPGSKRHLGQEPMSQAELLRDLRELIEAKAHGTVQDHLDLERLHAADRPEVSACLCHVLSDWMITAKTRWRVDHLARHVLQNKERVPLDLQRLAYFGAVKAWAEKSSFKEKEIDPTLRIRKIFEWLEIGKKSGDEKTSKLLGLLEKRLLNGPLKESASPEHDLAEKIFRLHLIAQSDFNRGGLAK